MDQPNSTTNQKAPPKGEGFPRGITASDVAYTIEVWQPHYRKTLSESDAVEMLVNVMRLSDAIQEMCGDGEQVE